MLIPFDRLFSKYNLQFEGVLHIGANRAEERIIYAELGMYRQVWFEANPEMYKLAVENINVDRILGGEVYNYAVGNEDKSITLNISNNAGQSSSILELGNHLIDHPNVQYIDKIRVPMKKIDTLVKEGVFKIKGLDFLNIDIQGYELEALKGMCDYLSQFKGIYLEVNRKETYIGCPLVEEIDLFLDQYRFTRVETKWAGNTGWGDALYLPKERS